MAFLLDMVEKEIPVISDDFQTHSILLRKVTRTVYDAFKCILGETKLSFGHYWL